VQSQHTGAISLLELFWQEFFIEMDGGPFFTMFLIFGINVTAFAWATRKFLKKRGLVFPGFTRSLTIFSCLFCLSGPLVSLFLFIIGSEPKTYILYGSLVALTFTMLNRLLGNIIRSKVLKA
jgi:hypothetical protein